MHSVLLLGSLGIACLLRWGFSQVRPSPVAQSWEQRWQWGLSLFGVPPLFLGMTAIAVLNMGHHGSMLGRSVGWLGCHSVGVLGAIALVALGLQAVQTAYTVWQIRQLPVQPIQDMSDLQMTDLQVTGRHIESTVPFAARVGFWQPDLVVSRALATQLSPNELQAVLLHEQAHLHFRDTFWFFWLGWIRQCTRWLPQTEALWQELLLLREIRADRWAAQFVDPLVIAEALLKMTQAAAQATANSPAWQGAAFTEMDTETRLEARIRALLSTPQTLSHLPAKVSGAYASAKVDVNDFNEVNGWWLSAGALISLVPLLSSLYHSGL